MISCMRISCISENDSAIVSCSVLAFDDFREAGFVNAIKDGIPTNISPTRLEGSMTYDNIWIKQSGREDRQEYTGRSG